jgi:hypothetical protein
MRTILIATILALFTNAIAGNHAAQNFSTSALPFKSSTATAPSPEPVPDNKIVRFSRALEYWNAGLYPTQAQLTGEWKNVGRNTDVACRDIQADEYNSLGLKNSDGTIPTLKFSVVSTGDDFGGATGQNIFAVNLNNFGLEDADQGPYSVKLSPGEPQFAQYPYTAYGMSTSVYLGYDCRLLANNTSRMICGLTARLEKPEDFSDSVKACADHMGAFLLFIKK